MYLSNDGKRFFAQDEDHLVAMLRRDSFTPSASFEDFMRDVAQRALLQIGQTIRTDSPANFVMDLIKAGLITEQPLN
jgi:hypothetical protein